MMFLNNMANDPLSVLYSSQSLYKPEDTTMVTKSTDSLDEFMINEKFQHPIILME